MVRSQETPLSTTIRRQHLTHIAEAGIAAVSGSKLVADALDDPNIRSILRGRRIALIAAGKVAAPMAVAFLERWEEPLIWAVAAGTTGEVPTDRCEWYSAGHPVPTGESEAAGRRVLDLTSTVDEEDVVLFLLSGGASACLAVPIEGLTLTDKIQATDALLRGGVPIDGINCVRKHLSAIKGGRLALATAGRVLTLAISDVVGPVPDDTAVIGSGPTAGDPTTFADAIAVVDSPSVRPHFPFAARTALIRGGRGELSDTPTSDDPRLARSTVRVIGNGAVAIRAAAVASVKLGYSVVTIEEPVVGEARMAAPAHLANALRAAEGLPRPVCVISAGETTVEVKGPGRGGRNQEFALALVELLAQSNSDIAIVSVGTDGVDGPTDAAGAIADRTTLSRANRAGIGSPRKFLEENDSHAFFQLLNDLVRTGPTETNVGDLQVILIDDAHS